MSGTHPGRVVFLIRVSKARRLAYSSLLAGLCFALRIFFPFVNNAARPIFYPFRTFPPRGRATATATTKATTRETL